MGIVSLPRTTVLPELGTPPGRWWHGRLWVSAEPLAELEPYQRCLDRFPVTGLWPVLIPSDERFGPAGADWIDRPRHPVPLDEVDRRDPEQVLSRWWPGRCCRAECLEPLGAEFPGLVRRSPRRRDPPGEALWLAVLYATQRPGNRLGLVRSGRSADVPAVLGWDGAAGHSTDIAALTAVLRSWEDRFGIRLVGLGSSALMFSVAAPPTTAKRALGLAAEHRAFCPDGFRRQPGTLADVADGLMGLPVWHFRWTASAGTTSGGTVTRPAGCRSPAKAGHDPRFSNRTFRSLRSTSVTSKPAASHALACRELDVFPHHVVVPADLGRPPVTSALISEKPSSR